MTATPSAEMEVKLLPCPCCSGEPWDLGDVVVCKTCGLRTPQCCPDRRERWNRRPSSSIRREALEGEVKRLRAVLERISRMPGPIIDGPRGPTKFLAYGAVMEIIRALANDGKAVTPEDGTTT